VDDIASERAAAPRAESPQSAPQVFSRPRSRRRMGLALVATACLAAFGAFFLFRIPAAQKLTQKDIDAAVAHALEKLPLPSQAARAYEAIAPSVVRVRGFASEIEASNDNKTTPQSGDKTPNKALQKSPDSKQINPSDDDDSDGVGTGVVIKDDGTILTNLHVVSGAKRIKVQFHNNFETEATIIGVQPENDLAVLKPKALPDDLQAATMRSTQDLRPGDLVVAVGFPFGIGPSASAGVVSGLRREFRSPAGRRMLTNLIQFDAAANPGNSGGPLVTAEGEVVGIVTGILNPTEQRVFVGIGFAVPIENAASAVGMSPF
jgi:serine protease DegQ